MSNFVKIGGEYVNLEFVTRIAVMENQSGISDRILIYVGDTILVVDSALGGRERMDKVLAKLVELLEPEVLDDAVV